MSNEYVLRKIEYFKDKELRYCYDCLTGILNRETMMGYVNWLIKNGREFTFFLVDIDNFKNVNDTYGHLVGDVVIAQTAKYLVKMAGEEGVVARFGGDEFMIVFDGVSEYNEVWRYGHSIDMKIGDLKFEGIPNLAITVSMGISRFPLNASDYNGIMEVADKALYRAKMKGRNCFIIYLPEKHANISLKKEREKKFTSMQLCFNIFNHLTACGEDISMAISSVFKSFVSYYMFDHICIETKSRLNHSVVYTLSGFKDFEHIPYNMLESLINAAGYVSINQTSALSDENYHDLKREFEKQKISSLLYCKIAAYGVDYGFIRIDTVNTGRIWQNEEIAMIMMTANTLGLLLHYQRKTLEDLPFKEPTVAGSIE